jgi:hypothetical protein
MKLVQQPTLRSQAHLQVTPANARPKPAKELAYPNARQTENAAKLGQGQTNDKNGQLVTTCIKHLAISAYSNGTARIKSGCNLIRNRFEMPNVSYTQPLCLIITNF